MFMYNADDLVNAVLILGARQRRRLCYWYTYAPHDRIRPYHHRHGRTSVAAEWVWVGARWEVVCIHTSYEAAQ